MHILTVVGVQPQFIKAVVLSRYIRDKSSCGVTETLLHSGQNYDQNMGEVFLRRYGDTKT
jgi:UDP-N-acetylglucosamine 2-epimerase